MRVKITDMDTENIKGVTVDSLRDLHEHAHKTGEKGGLDREQVERLHDLCAAEMKRRQVRHDCPLEFPFPRGLYLAPPHGQLVYDGRKTAIARPYPDRNVEGEFVILSGEFAYGIAQIGQGQKTTLDQFDEQFEDHRCRAAERLEWWPDVKALWVYPIESFDPFIAPRLLTFSPGSMIIDHVQLVEDEKQHSRDQCMACKKEPEVDVQWADGRGRAWFCTKCFRDWAKKGQRDIIKAWWVADGQVADKAGGEGETSLWTRGAGAPEDALYERLAERMKAHSGVMVALIPPPEVAEALTAKAGAFPEGSRAIPAKEMHVTLTYLGDKDDLGEEKRGALQKAVGDFVADRGPLKCRIGGMGRFNKAENDGSNAVYASVDSPDLPAFRQGLVEVLEKAGLASPSEHGFTPHITMAYVPEGKQVSVEPPPEEFEMTNVAAAWGDDWTKYRLGRKEEAMEGKPWTLENPPPPAKNWTTQEIEKCVAAANAVLRDQDWESASAERRKEIEQQAVFACIRNAGRSTRKEIVFVDGRDVFPEKVERDLGMVGIAVGGHVFPGLATVLDGEKGLRYNVEFDPPIQIEGKGFDDAIYAISTPMAMDDEAAWVAAQAEIAGAIPVDRLIVEEEKDVLDDLDDDEIDDLIEALKEAGADEAHISILDDLKGGRGSGHWGHMGGRGGRRRGGSRPSRSASARRRSRHRRAQAMGKRIVLNPSDKRALEPFRVRREDLATYSQAMDLESDDAKAMLKRAGKTREEAYADIEEARKKQQGAEFTSKLHQDEEGVYTPERQKLHDEIVDDFLRDAPSVPEGEQPTVIFTGGYPGSGKSSMMRNAQYASRLDDFVKLDSDEIKGRLGKADGIDSITWQAQAYHPESNDVLQRVLQGAITNRQNLIYDGTMKQGAKIGSIMEQFRERGYRVEIAFADLPMQKSMERAVGRFLGGGRFVDPAYIASHDAKNIASLSHLKDKADVWRHWNTDVPYGQAATLVSEG